MSKYTRRTILKAGSVGATGLVLAANLASCQPIDLAVGAPTLEPTPSCDDGDHEPTEQNAEGPFYTPSTPERTVLVGVDDPGTRLLMTGRVVNIQCQPIAGALLDFWHTDDAGDYDNEGFTFRGHQFADDEGNYRLETILPGIYTGRTRHIHVKVTSPSGSTLTTQTYFADDPGNAVDRLILPSLLMPVIDHEDGSKSATFDFVLDYAVAEAPLTEDHKIYFPLIEQS